MKQKLKKGTLVKHGTTSSALMDILNEGIIPQKSEYDRRQLLEASSYSNGIYVGKLIAYHSAFLSFASECYTAREMNTEFSIPIILNIELGKDCRFIADEDFILLNRRTDNGNGPISQEYLHLIPSALKSEAKVVWEKYGSTCLLLDKIPSNWILSFEHPKLTELSEFGIPSTEVQLDVMTFVFAYHQNVVLAPIDEYYENIRKNYNHSFSSLSNKEEFRQEEIVTFLNSPYLADKPSLRNYATNLWQDITDAGRQIGLPYA